ncbi:MAG TPA: hypothetical protein VL199_04480 [Burkholderiales bacterium]|jgi:hypothetical protein|nr:hypothetical protein [Burkholderiales bacterium]
MSFAAAAAALMAFTVQAQPLPDPGRRVDEPPKAQKPQPEPPKKQRPRISVHSREHRRGPDLSRWYDRAAEAQNK